MCLWSLATMNTKVMRVIKVLQKEIDLKLMDLSERELALTLWSFATLNHNPGILGDKIAETSELRLQKFQPQVLLQIYPLC